MKEYLIGHVTKLSIEDSKTCSRIAPDDEVDENKMLFLSLLSVSSEDSAKMIRFVVPESLQQGFLHHYHTRFRGGHQGNLSAHTIQISWEKTIPERLTGMWAKV